MLTATVIDTEEEAARIRASWDRLVADASRPFAAPGWTLAWWRHARPEGAELRLVAVHDGEDLVGLAPLMASGRSFETIAGHFSPPTGLVAAPGREDEVAAAVATALAEHPSGPTTLRLEDVGGSGSPPAALLDAWPGKRPWTHATPAAPLPIIRLDGQDFDAWFATKSSKFRQESRRMRRRLEDAGGSFALVDAAGAEAAIEAFVTLHGARWEDRGGSDALVPGIRDLLAEALTELGEERLRIYKVEVDGRIVAVNLLVAAGEEVCGWNSGFDEEWKKYSPSLLLTLYALEQAAERSEQRVNLGPGAGAYKDRLADEEGELGLLTLVPHGSGHLAARLGMARHQLRWALSERLSPESKARLKRWVRR